MILLNICEAINGRPIAICFSSNRLHSKEVECSYIFFSMPEVKPGEAGHITSY